MPQQTEKETEYEWDCVVCMDTGTAYWSDGIYGWCLECKKGDAIARKQGHLPDEDESFEHQYDEHEKLNLKALLK